MEREIIKHPTTGEDVWIEEEKCDCVCHRTNAIHMIACCDNGVLKRYKSVVSEIKKALYKEKPKAKRVGFRAAGKENTEAYKYETKLKDKTIIKFEVPFNEMGETVFGEEIDAQLLIRWLNYTPIGKDVI